MADDKPVYNMDAATSLSRSDVLYLVQGNGTLDRKLTLGDLYDLWSTLAASSGNSVALEDGTSILMLEDGTSELLLEP
jgi:hypothetical protein